MANIVTQQKTLVLKLLAECVLVQRHRNMAVKIIRGTLLLFVWVCGTVFSIRFK